jgi:glucose-6-phosphate 1-dehydrogenase
VTSQQPPADALVLFGATGDLSKKKLFPALYNMERHGQLRVPVIGVARSSWNDEGFRQHAHDAILTAIPDAAAATIDALCQRLDLIAGDYADLATFQGLAATLDRHHSNNAVFYLAIPPSAFPLVIESLDSVGVNKRGRVVVEKPFGRDPHSALELNTVLHQSFPEERIFRIDHYLGKESVEDLLVFRFSNTLLEPVWNRNYVKSVQLTMSETIGVEGRGTFYDSVGAVRDVVQNHVMQVIALLAMEPPVGPEAAFLQDEKSKVFSAMQSLCCKEGSFVRGQYDGYLSEPGVAPGSKTETFVAARVFIDSWRWAGVPFYLRAGKALAMSATEAVVEFHEPPRMLFDEAGGPSPHGNLVRFRLGNDDGVTFTLQAKTPGPHLDSEDVNLRVDFTSALGQRQEAYERLLDDALAGNPRRFAREDVVERTWRVVEPALTYDGPVYPYPRGSWGPTEAEALVPGGWFPPS